MLKLRKNIAWFTQDLRLHDQAMLSAASQQCDEMLCVYIIEPWMITPGRFGYPGLAQPRQQFITESLADLNMSLQSHGQQLHIFEGHSATVISELIAKLSIDKVYRSDIAGSYEQQSWQQLSSQNTNCEFHLAATSSLFKKEQLPFSINQLPPTFTRFRKKVEQLDCRDVTPAVTELPEPISGLPFTAHPWQQTKQSQSKLFQGGETGGLTHIKQYFAQPLASHYKEVRNALDGFTNSTKFSPWLAMGSLSAPRILADLKKYERLHGANDSTYWIYFELLWREFFYWHAQQHGNKLFQFGGIQQRSPLTSYYPERFQKWAAGNTPYPLVNAIMHELTATGYISNRARQITASCLVNELALDWRFGAAWFEHCLIDYDVASNWGNWQYLAGVGADAQPKRHFNLSKQQQQFDPDGSYIERWQGDAGSPALDSVDAADWPI